MADITVNIKAKVDQFKNEMQNVMKGMSGNIGAKGLAVGGIAAGGAVAVLKMIHDKMTKQLRILKESSGAFKGAQDTLDRMYSLVMQPIGNMMSMLMKPYLILQMNILRRGMKEASGVMKGMKTGDISQEEGMKELEKITSAMYMAMEPVQLEMQKVITPLKGFAAATKDMFDVSVGIPQVFEDFKGYVSGFVENAKMSGDPEVIGKAATYLGGSLTDMSDEMALQLTPKLQDFRQDVVDAGGSAEGLSGIIDTMIDDAGAMPTFQRALLSTAAKAYAAGQDFDSTAEALASARAKLKQETVTASGGNAGASYRSGVQGQLEAGWNKMGITPSKQYMKYIWGEG